MCGDLYFYRGGANAAQLSNGSGGYDIWVLCRRPQWHQPVGRRIREWPTTTRQYPPKNRRISALGSKALRHLTYPTSQQWMRFQDTWKVIDL